MSTITKELAKLFRKITNSEIDAEGNAHVVLSPADSLLINNARIALASLEAEPVAWLLSGGGAKNNVSFDSGNAYADPLREVTPLYTAPPAPVSVPAAMEIDDDFDSAFEHGKAVGWNAYRAAMLQAEPVSNSDELPDGWVACSERMPDRGKKVLIRISCSDHFNIESGEYKGDGLWLGCWFDTYGKKGSAYQVAHWMPLPAAPQQEA